MAGLEGTTLEVYFQNQVSMTDMGSSWHGPPMSSGLAKVLLPFGGDPSSHCLGKVWMLPDNPWNKS